MTTNFGGVDVVPLLGAIVGTIVVCYGGGRGCFSFGGTVQYIEESNIYLCFVVCRLKRGLVT